MLRHALPFHDILQAMLQHRRRPLVEKHDPEGVDDPFRPQYIANQVISKHEVLQKLFDELGPRYQDRSGGYTRVIRGKTRKSDGAKMGYIQLV